MTTKKQLNYLFAIEKLMDVLKANNVTPSVDLVETYEQAKQDLENHHNKFDPKDR